MCTLNPENDGCLMAPPCTLGVLQGSHSRWLDVLTDPAVVTGTHWALAQLTVRWVAGYHEGAPWWFTPPAMPAGVRAP